MVIYHHRSGEYSRSPVQGPRRLIPDGENFDRLESDYYAMERSGMLNGHFYPLGGIMDDLTALQEHVNQLALGRKAVV